MSKVEYPISFHCMGDEIERLERKNTKYVLCYTIAKVRAIVCSENLSDTEKLERIKEKIVMSYWS